MSEAHVTSYRVVVPQPWVRIPVRGGGTAERISQVVARAAERLPKEMPPDERGPWVREQERRLATSVREAEDNGGVDLYLPSGPSHGILVGASIVVSEVKPPGASGGDGDALVGGVYAELVADGAVPVTIDGTTWVRSERVVAPDLARVEVDVPTRRVTYTAALPDDPRSWVLVAFSCVGDGDPDSENTRIVVDLFDAIMGTWRWIRAGETWDRDVVLEGGA
jgi:hypothetical protein